MWPEFEKEKGYPRGSLDLQGGYVLMTPRDLCAYKLSCTEQDALEAKFVDNPDVNTHTVFHWAHLRLPSEQITRLQWKEQEHYFNMRRTDHNIKVCE